MNTEDENTRMYLQTGKTPTYPTVNPHDLIELGGNASTTEQSQQKVFKHQKAEYTLVNNQRIIIQKDEDTYHILAKIEGLLMFSVTIFFIGVIVGIVITSLTFYYNI